MWFITVRDRNNEKQNEMTTEELKEAHTKISERYAKEQVINELEHLSDLCEKSATGMYSDVRLRQRLEQLKAELKS